uniref:Secreted protein n=1 Tax=Globodera rostochiensis TaxID=31243 RepID=A0A914GUD9_GLORO
MLLKLYVIIFGQNYPSRFVSVQQCGQYCPVREQPGGQIGDRNASFYRFPICAFWPGNAEETTNCGSNDIIARNIGIRSIGAKA